MDNAYVAAFARLPSLDRPRRTVARHEETVRGRAAATRRPDHPAGPERATAQYRRQREALLCRQVPQGVRREAAGRTAARCRRLATADSGQGGHGLRGGAASWCAHDGFNTNQETRVAILDWTAATLAGRREDGYRRAGRVRLARGPEEAGPRGPPEDRPPTPTPTWPRTPRTPSANSTSRPSRPWSSRSAACPWSEPAGRGMVTRSRKRQFTG